MTSPPGTSNMCGSTCNTETQTRQLDPQAFIAKSTSVRDLSREAQSVDKVSFYGQTFGRADRLG